MKTKKLLAMLLAMVMLLSLCACGEKKPEFEFNPKELFIGKVKADVTVECMNVYQDVKVAVTTITDIDVYGDEYTGKGKVTITDDYGDKYVGKVTAVYRYDEESHRFSKISLNIERPRKEHLFR